MTPTNNSQSFDAFVADTVKQQLAQQAAANGQPLQQTQPEPLVLNVGGQQFQYQSKAELEAALNNFVGAAGQKFAELQNQAQAAQAQPQQGSYVSGDDPVAQWSDPEFIKNMTESPKAGFEYAFNKLFFDGKSEDPVGDMKAALHATEMTKRTMAALQFKENHPEFPGGAQAAQVIDNVRQQMGLPYDYDGLEAAYLVGMQRGALPNFYQQHQQAQQAAQWQAQQAQGQQQQDFQPQQGFQPQAQMDPRAFNGGFGINGQFPQANPYLTAPPGVNRNNAFAPQGQVNYDDLSTEQIEGIFARMGKPIQGGKY